MILKRRIFIEKEWKHKQILGKKQRKKKNRSKEKENLEKHVMLLSQGYWGWINPRKYWWDNYKIWKIIDKPNKLRQKRLKITIKIEIKTFHHILKNSIAIMIIKSKHLISKEHKWMISWPYQSKSKTSKNRWKKIVNSWITKRPTKQFNQWKQTNGNISVKFVKKDSFYQPYWNSK